MTVEVKLYKKRAIYTDANGVEKRVWNLYVRVGTEYIPVDVVFFANDKCEGRDPAYAGRRAIIEAIAELIPPKETNARAGTSAQEGNNNAQTA